ncbi:MAG TPA: DUF4271 domain-containing protein [Cytophagaceae bacterium]|jgi:hypothetical protein|nr:DUF4271 domain-containing protein [Cytophagaceae bacterium]
MSKILIIFFVILADFYPSYCVSFFTKDSLDKNIVKDLSDEWLVFDRKSNSYVPFLERPHFYQALSRKIDLEKYREYNLNFIADPGLSLFINNKLYYTNPTSRIFFVRFSLNSIPQGKFKTEDLITFYNSRKGLPEKDCYIGQDLQVKNGYKETTHLFPEILKKKFQGDNIFIVLFLIIMFLFGLVKNKYPKKFMEFYDYSRILPVSAPEDNFILEIYSIPSILFILINAVSCSLLLGIVAEGRQTLFGLSYASVGGILIVAGITIMIYFIKYFYLKMLGNIFNLRQIIRIQFFELIKVSSKLNLVCVPLALFFFYSRSEMLEISYKYFLYTLILCGLIAVIRISFLIFKYSNFRNIYLFSYLCITEILPLIIIIKVILF